MSKIDPIAVAQRIQQYCAWFNIAPPARLSAKELTLGEATEWTAKNGASFDWIFKGCNKSMASAFREAEATALSLENLQEMENQFRHVSDLSEALELACQKLNDHDITDHELKDLRSAINGVSGAIAAACRAYF